jgi:hypothetical protein
MYSIGSQGIGETLISTSFLNKPTSQGKWQIRIMNKSGGQVANWFFSQDDCPIESLSFELNKKICGAGSIKFSFIDFPLDADDYVEVRYNGLLIYSALIDISIDPKGGEILLIPFSQRLSELQITKSYTNQTAAAIFLDIITSVQTYTGINYISFYVDTDSTELYTLDYTAYESPYKMIDDLVKNLNDKFWGVTANRTFTVYNMDTTTSQSFFYGDDPAYTKIKEKTDYTSLKNTRYIVQKKSSDTEGTVATLGIVGGGGSYPILPIEKTVRTKIGKMTISEYISSDSDALQIAYNQLIAETSVIPQTIDVENFDLSRLYDPENIIGTRITVQDYPEYINRILLNCDSLTDDSDDMVNNGFWTGCTIDTTTYLHGTGSITFANECTYTFGRAIRIYSPVLISFQIYADSVCQIAFDMTNYGNNMGYAGIGYAGIDTDIGETLFDNPQIMTIDTPNVWVNQKVTLPVTTFSKLGFQVIGSATVNIDRVQVFCIHRSLYTAPIVQCNVKLDQKETIKLKLNEYDTKANDKAFDDSRRIAKLEAIAHTTA